MIFRSLPITVIFFFLPKNSENKVSAAPLSRKESGKLPEYAFDFCFVGHCESHVHIQCAHRSYTTDGLPFSSLDLKMRAVE